MANTVSDACELLSDINACGFVLLYDGSRFDWYPQLPLPDSVWYRFLAQQVQIRELLLSWRLA